MVCVGGGRQGGRLRSGGRNRLGMAAGRPRAMVNSQDVCSSECWKKRVAKETFIAAKRAQGERLHDGPKRVQTTPLGVMMLPSAAVDLRARKRGNCEMHQVLSPRSRLGARASVGSVAVGSLAPSEAMSRGRSARAASAASALPMSAVGADAAAGHENHPARSQRLGAPRSEASYPATPCFSEAGDADAVAEIACRMAQLEAELAIERAKREAIEARLRQFNAQRGCTSRDPIVEAPHQRAGSTAAATPL